MRLFRRRGETETGAPEDEGVHEWQPRLYAKLLILAVVIAYVVGFVLENDKNVKVRFVFGSSRVSLIWLILLSLALGLSAGCCYPSSTATGTADTRRARRVTPSSISAGETKLNASRSEFDRPAEVGAGHERHAGLRRRTEQLGRIGALGEVEPEEVAALRAVPARAAGELAVERLEHRVTPFAQEPGHALEVRLEQAAPEEIVDRRLRQQGRRDVRRGDQRLELRGQRGRHDQVADPQPRRDRLRERRAVEDVLAAIELEQARQRLALEPHEPVGVVLEHAQLPLAGEVASRRRRSSEGRPPVGF